MSQNLKFFRGNSTKVQNAGVGAIWFDTDNNVIKVCTKIDESGGKTWEAYSGLQDATWNKETNKLVFTKPDGESVVEIDFSDVASKAAIEQKFTGLKVEDTAVTGEYVSSVSQADGKITVTRAALPDYTEVYDTKGAAAEALDDAKAYADSLAVNYDAKGAAATAEQNAKDYADDKIAEAVGTWTDGETAGTGLRKEIEEKVAAVAAEAKSYSIAPVTGDELSALGTNVKEAYKLVDEDNTKVGEVIKIYKDSALQSVVLDEQELVFTYLLATGAEDVVRVDVSKFLAESEFGDGLQVNSESGIVSVKVDTASEEFLTVSADGIKLSGVQNAINTAEGNAKSYADGLNTAIDARVDVLEAINHNQLAADAAASAISNLDSTATAADTNSYVSVTIAEVDGKVVDEGSSVSVKTGSVADSSDALAIASDVKTYVDNKVTSGLEWAEF